MCLWIDALWQYVTNGHKWHDENDITATSWVESMVDGDWLSSDDDDDDESFTSDSETMKTSRRLVSFQFELDDDSVEDVDYYKEYARFNHQSTTLSEREILDFLHMARNKANENRDCMTPTVFHDILKIYELILASCDLKYKRYLIHEYETIKASYPADAIEMDQAYREYEKARNFQLGRQQQCFHYRNAIAYMPSLEIKSKWKKEYNAFLNTRTK